MGKGVALLGHRESLHVAVRYVMVRGSYRKDVNMDVACLECQRLISSVLTVAVGEAGMENIVSEQTAFRHPGWMFLHRKNQV